MSPRPAKKGRGLPPQGPSDERVSTRMTSSLSARGWDELLTFALDDHLFYKERISFCMAPYWPSIAAEHLPCLAMRGLMWHYLLPGLSAEGLMPFMLTFLASNGEEASDNRAEPGVNTRMGATQQ